MMRKYDIKAGLFPLLSLAWFTMTFMNEFEEKRRFTRLKAECKLFFKRVDSKAIHEGLCLNISSSGLMFKTKHPVTAGKALEIRTLSENPIVPCLIAYIEVVRCHKVDLLSDYLIAGAIKVIKGA